MNAKSRTSNKIAIFLLLTTLSTATAFASDGEVISLCANTIKLKSNIQVDKFNAKFDGSIIGYDDVYWSDSSGKSEWKEIHCKASSDTVYNLKIDDVMIIYQKFDSKESFDKFQEISKSIDEAIQKLETRISLLKSTKVEIKKALQTSSQNIASSDEEANRTILRALGGN